MLKRFVILLIVSFFVQAADPPPTNDPSGCKKQGHEIVEGADPIGHLSAGLPVPDKQEDLIGVPNIPGMRRAAVPGWIRLKNFMGSSEKATTLSVDDVQAWISGTKLASISRIDPEFIELYKQSTGETVTHDVDQDIKGFLLAHNADPEKLHLLSSTGSQGNVYTHPDFPGKIFKVTKGGTIKSQRNTAIEFAYQLMMLRVAVRKAGIPLIDGARVDHIGKNFFMREYNEDSIVRPGTTRVKEICARQGFDFEKQWPETEKLVNSHPGLAMLIAQNLGANQHCVSESELKRSIAAGNPRLYVIYDID